MTEETFSVVQWLPDGFHEYLERGVSAERAMQVARSYTRPNRPAVLMGVIRRVIIEDSDGCTVFDWRNGQGVVWPTRNAQGRFVEDGPPPAEWTG